MVGGDPATGIEPYLWPSESQSQPPAHGRLSSFPLEFVAALRSRRNDLCYGISVRIHHISITVGSYIAVRRVEVILGNERLRDRAVWDVIGVVRSEYRSNRDLRCLLSGQPVPRRALAVAPATAGNDTRIFARTCRRRNG